MVYNISLEIFEGPFELLFHLIEKNELDIYDIPIVSITDQYLDYLTKAEELDLELTSEFLVMAATLLSIKAKMLLPKPPKNTETDSEEYTDPRDELVERLIEYKKFKAAANFLQEKASIMNSVYWRNIDEVQLIKEFGQSNPVENLSLLDIFQAFQQVLKRAEEEKKVFILPRDEITIGQQTKFIMSTLGKDNQGISFNNFFGNDVSRIEIIVTFLALLELFKQGKIIIRQKNIFEEIKIYLREQ